MIVSFHPCFSGDRHINTGDRALTEDDLAAIKNSSMVILPQACRRDLFQAARKYAGAVFPDLRTRFDYPGKTGQIRLFRETGTPHPRSFVYPDTAAFRQDPANPIVAGGISFPLVFKFDWSDEGRGVFRADDRKTLERILLQAEQAEATGQKGFVIQEYIETRGRVLRVCVINTAVIAYWKKRLDPDEFAVNLAGNAVIDRTSYPELRRRGVAAVQTFCRRTGINLAGFDLLFDGLKPDSTPLLLEINYYFGRRGLGGSERYYHLLNREIDKWVNDHRDHQETPTRPGAE
ncbi:MAG: RimK family alpha-L-glutamate ligase [Desulfosudaceae bacterium]